MGASRVRQFGDSDGLDAGERVVSVGACLGPVENCEQIAERIVRKLSCEVFPFREYSIACQWYYLQDSVDNLCIRENCISSAA